MADYEKHLSSGTMLWLVTGDARLLVERAVDEIVAWGKLRCGPPAFNLTIARAGDDSGLWPLVISRFASALLIVPLALARHAFTMIHGRMLGVVLLAGTCDALANLCFLLASRHGLLSVASVLTALYPATTVILAVWLLREHTSPVQRWGLALAAGSIVLITV